jgi:hypothetical protein
MKKTQKKHSTLVKDLRLNVSEILFLISVALSAILLLAALCVLAVPI